MHPIKKQILYQLITNSSLPYSKLKPNDVESNLFIYHLKQLITEDLVVKKNDGKYELSDEGKKYADNLSLKNLQPRIQPKIVTLIVCKNNKGEVLLYKRKRQPFLGLVGFPYGKIHLGEKISEAALRELKEKTGLVSKLSHKGDAYLTTFKDDKLISQMFCHVFAGEDPKGELVVKSEIGECFWENIKNSKADKFMPGFDDVYNLINKPLRNLFFEEFVYVY